MFFGSFYFRNHFNGEERSGFFTLFACLMSCDLEFSVFFSISAIILTRKGDLVALL